MKLPKSVVICVSLVLASCIVLHWQPISDQAYAQDSPKKSKSDASEKAARPPLELTLPDRPYPTFSAEIVVTQLKTATVALMKKNVAKSSDVLKKNLELTETSLKLPRASTKETSPQELYKRACESVYLLAGMTKPKEKDDDDNWQTALATAFAVHEDGILSTSAHVFDHDDHDDAVVVMDVQGKVYPVVELLAVDREADTCFFRIAAKGLKPLPLGKDLPPGSPIRVMGHPGDSFFFFSAGIIANYERDEDGLVWLNVTADFGQGSSGGPVMDIYGNVVGQVSRTYTLFASGDTIHRGQRIRRVRQTSDSNATQEKKAEGAKPEESLEKHEHEHKKRADTQMVFKACTPVSAIRGLVK